GFLRPVFDCCSRLVRQSFESASTTVRLAFDKPSATLRETAEAQPSNCRTSVLPYPNQCRTVAPPYPAVYALLPLYSRNTFAKISLLGLFTEVSAGHMRIGSEGRVREGGLEHGFGWVFRRLGIPSPALLLPMFSHLAWHPHAVCGRYVKFFRIRLDRKSV